MGLGIDAAREARHDHESGAGEIPSQRAREGSRRPCRGSRSHDGDRRTAQDLRSPAHGENQWCVVEHAQAFRIGLVGQRNDPRSEAFVARARRGERGFTRREIDARAREQLVRIASRAQLRREALGMEGELGLERDPDA
jgi:hypothetical protein